MVMAGALMTPKQFERLPPLFQEIVESSRGLEELCSQSIVPLQTTREMFARHLTLVAGADAIYRPLGGPQGATA